MSSLDPDSSAAFDPTNAADAVSRIKLSIAERRAEVARLTGQGLNAGEIAAKLNVPRGTVGNDRAALGLPAGKRGSKPDPDLADRRAAIVADVNAGMRYPDVAAKHGCSVSNIKIAVYLARKAGNTVSVARSAGFDPVVRAAIIAKLMAGLSWSSTVRALSSDHPSINRDLISRIVKDATPEERSEIKAAVAARVKKSRPEKTARPVVVKAPAPRRVERAPSTLMPATAKKPVAALKARPVVAPVSKPPVAERAPRIAAPTERDERRKIADTAFGPERSDFGVVAAVMACANGKCRWPVGDPATPGFRFCLAVTEPAQIYCAAHSALSRVPGSAAKIKAYDPTVVPVSRARDGVASVDLVLR